MRWLFDINTRVRTAKLVIILELLVIVKRRALVKPLKISVLVCLFSKDLGTEGDTGQTNQLTGHPNKKKKNKRQTGRYRFLWW